MDIQIVVKQKLFKNDCFEMIILKWHFQNGSSNKP